jgi:NTP pyrophosphatase (non-canonical NTP hydrolase)
MRTDIFSKAEVQVTAFHYRNGFKIGDPIHQEFHRGDSWMNVLLKFCCMILRWLCKFIGKRATKEMVGARKDCRLYRSWLMLEELQEVMFAMSQGDEIKYADGLGDLLYVVVGSAVSNDIPLQFVVDEIQDANMKKKKRTSNNLRMRDKGINWKRPDIEKALKNGRIYKSALIIEAKKEVERYANS